MTYSPYGLSISKKNSDKFNNFHYCYINLPSGRVAEIPSFASASRVIAIPANAPEEVKQIMDKKVPITGNAFQLSDIDNEIITVEKLKIANMLKEKGYNPTDYNLDIEELNLRLEMYKLNEDYRKVKKNAKQFETLRKAPKGVQPENISTEIFYAYNRAYEKCEAEIPFYKRLFSNTSTLVTNPYLKEAEHFKTLIRQLSKKIDEQTAAQEQNKKSEKFIFTATNPAYK